MVVVGWSWWWGGRGGGRGGHGGRGRGRGRGGRGRGGRGRGRGGGGGGRGGWGGGGGGVKNHEDFFLAMNQYLLVGYLQNGTASNLALDNMVIAINSNFKSKVNFQLKYFDFNQMKSDSYQLLGKCLCF